MIADRVLRLGSDYAIAPPPEVVTPDQAAPMPHNPACILSGEDHHEVLLKVG